MHGKMCVTRRKWADASVFSCVGIRDLSSVLVSFLPVAVVEQKVKCVAVQY
jgi:hypothetical protein